MSIAIVTDSTSYIPKDEIEKYKIRIVPLQVVFGNEAYREGFEITEPDFYEKLQQSAQLPTTSQPSVGEFVDTYEELFKEHSGVISIHLSSKISGTFQGAETAASMVENATVDVFDSQIACYALGFLVVEAAKLASEGKSREEILDRLEEVRSSIKAYFLVEDLEYLYKGGRLNRAQLMLGNMLKIKPVLTFEEGSIVPFEKIRTKSKAKNRIKELFEQDAQLGKPMRATIIHGNIMDEAQEWLKEIQQNYPHVEFTVTPFGPVIGTHLGPGSLGLSWYIV